MSKETLFTHTKTNSKQHTATEQQQQISCMRGYWNCFKTYYFNWLL